TTLSPLDHGAVVVEVTNPPTASEKAVALFQLQSPDPSEVVAMNVSNGVLQLEGGTQVTRPFDPNVRFLRMQAGVGRVVMQTSIDGVVFRTERIVPAPSWLALGPVLELGAQRLGAVGGDVDVSFEH